MRVLYLFSKPRNKIYEDYKNGFSPDDLLYGLKKMDLFGVESIFTDRAFNKTIFSFFFKYFHVIMAKLGNQIGFNIEQALRLRQEINRHDLVFTTADSNGLPVAFLKSIGLINVPIVYTTIGLTHYLRKRTLIFLFYKNLLKYTEKIIHYGYQEGQELIEMFDVPFEKIEFLNFTVDIDFFKPENNTTNKDFIVSVGADMQRDWKTFFDAVKDVNIKIELICNSAHLKNLPIPKNVCVRSNVPIIEVREKYAKSRFVVIPVKENSYTAGIITLLQAMAMGKAVIVSQTAAISEGYNLRHRENCWLVKPGNVKELKSAIEYLQNNREEVARIGLLARKTVETKFTRKQYVQNLAKIFREVYKKEEVKSKEI